MRPLNPDQLDEWIQQGIIEPANSPWASTLVPVKKKDGRTRWVTDLRQLNDVTIKDAYPLTNIQENLQKLKGAKNLHFHRCLWGVTSNTDRIGEQGLYRFY